MSSPPVDNPFENFTPLQEGRRLPKPVWSTSGAKIDSDDDEKTKLMLLRESSVEKFCVLCPSMDLIAVGFVGGGSTATKAKTGGTNQETSTGTDEIVDIPFVETIHVHRTVSWQRLLTFGPSELVMSSSSEGAAVASLTLSTLDNIFLHSRFRGKGGMSISTTDVSASSKNADIVKKREDDGRTNYEDERASTAPSSRSSSGATCIGWSPDGRALVIGMNDGRVHLYHVESSSGSNAAKLVHVTSSSATFSAKRGPAISTSSMTSKTPPRDITQGTKSSKLVAVAAKKRQVAKSTSQQQQLQKVTKAPNTGIAAPSPIMTRSRAAAKRRQQQQQQQVELQNQNKSSLLSSAAPAMTTTSQQQKRGGRGGGRSGNTLQRKRQMAEVDCSSTTVIEESQKEIQPSQQQKKKNLHSNAKEMEDGGSFYPAEETIAPAMGPQHAAVVGLCWAKRTINSNLPTAMGRSDGSHEILPGLTSDDSGDDDDDDEDDFSLFDEEEIEETWMIQKQFFDRASLFLPENPRMDISPGSAGGGGDKLSSLSFAAGSSNTTSSIRDHSSRERVTALVRNGTTCPPSPKIDLNVLCVVGASNSLSVYLHGRYRILTLLPPPPPLPTNKSILCTADTVRTTTRTIGAQITCAVDLGCILVAPATIMVSRKTSDDDNSKKHVEEKEDVRSTSHNNIVHWYSTPSLSCRHRELGVLSYSYSFVGAQIHGIVESLDDLSQIWSSDQLFKALQTAYWSKLMEALKHYGVLAATTTQDPNSNTATDAASIQTKSEAEICRRELHNTLSMGCLSGSRLQEGKGASAMNQFFSQLSEHALNRHSKAIQTQLSKMEEIMKREVLGPAQALVYHCSNELLGIAKATGGGEQLLHHHDQHGIKKQTNLNNKNNPSKSLLNEGTMRRALDVSRSLYIATERCLRNLLVVRHRMQDLLQWMVWQIQAVKTYEKGGADNNKDDTATAANAARSNNTNSFSRPSQALLDRVLTFLSEPSSRSFHRSKHDKKNNFDEKAESGIPTFTEIILGVNVMRDLIGNCSMVQRQDESANNTKTSETEECECLPSSYTSETPLHKLVRATQSIYHEVFAGPRNQMNHFVTSRVLDFTKGNGSDALGEDVSYTRLVMHKRAKMWAARIGTTEIASAGSHSDDFDPVRPLFSLQPSSLGEHESKTAIFPGACRHWMLFAQGQNQTRMVNCAGNEAIVQLIAIPSDAFNHNAWNKYSGHRQHDSSCGRQQNFYLTAFIQLPLPQHTNSSDRAADNTTTSFTRVTQVCFYGDDGDSSLSVELSSAETVRSHHLGCSSSNERRQKLAIFVETVTTRRDDLVPQPSSSSLTREQHGELDYITTVTEELWLVDYRNAIFSCHPFSHTGQSNTLVSLSPTLQNDSDVLSTISFQHADQKEKEDDADDVSNDDEKEGAITSPSLGILEAKRRMIRTNTTASTRQTRTESGDEKESRLTSSEGPPRNTVTTTSSNHSCYFVGCGSRGVGCVLSNGNVLNLYDMEEDEEDHEEDDEDDSSE